MKFEDKLVATLRRFNHLLHGLLAIALVIASMMVMWEFSSAVVHAVNQGNLAHGFLQALGTLFIVWTLSSLISAEINFVQSGVFHLLVFIEVAIITLLRQLIVEPVQMAAANHDLSSSSSLVHYSLILAATTRSGYRSQTRCKLRRPDTKSRKGRFESLPHGQHTIENHQRLRRETVTGQTADHGIRPLSSGRKKLVNVRRHIDCAARICAI
jgi:uncharacterized membrane protein (DUF373 family)